MASKSLGVSTAAARYAYALFDLALDAKSIDVVMADLNNLQSMLEESEELRHVVASPLLSRHEKTAAISAISKKAGLSELTNNFLGVISENRRLYELSPMITAFNEAVSKHNGEVAASVTSAVVLSKAQVTAIDKALKKSVGTKVAVDYKVDETIIGGLVVQVGSKLIDSSLKSKLNRLELAMKGLG